MLFYPYSRRCRRGIAFNLHVGVYPPDGKVRVSAPLRLDDEAIRLAVLSRISWIRRHQQNFLRQARQSAREMVTGESHYFQGQRYRLNLVEQPGRQQVRLVNNTTLELQVKPGTDATGRRRLLECWYREQMRARLPDLVGKWEPVMGMEVAECRIKRMKTRWGSCNIGARRVWLNLELIKKPAACLEYINRLRVVSNCPGGVLAPDVFIILTIAEAAAFQAEKKHRKCY